jgi:Asp-tRNA(Asn)/Glu-tRNA(Gln) amidotransferase A subunit family amidase
MSEMSGGLSRGERTRFAERVDLRRRPRLCGSSRLRGACAAPARYLARMSEPIEPPGGTSRREILASAAAFGATVAAAALSRDAIAATPMGQAAPPPPSDASKGVTVGTIAEAEKLAGVSFTEAERAQIARTVVDQVATIKARLAFGALDNQSPPAQVFRVLLPGESVRAAVRPLESRLRYGKGPDAPSSDADLDFATVETLSRWIGIGSVTSRRLVERSLARLRKANPTLRCAITIVEEQALAEADARDAEHRAGKPRGRLHGIPYGLKDIFDTKGILTTWGAEPWRERVPTSDAVVVERLREAGAVLVAKTAVGALAYGDIWFGGTCRNPWNPEQGSSGSSAGSASAVAAGCVPFAIGTETLGSIVSPCVRCGTTGLRPTFGRVPRDGCMSLCWSWDKIGPITRGVLDTGIVLEAINGASAGDPSSVESGFFAPRAARTKDVRVGYDPAWFEGPNAALSDTLAAARDAGLELVERKVTPPCDPGVLVSSLMAEAAASFEDMTRTDADDLLSWQADEAWPNSFRRTAFLPAVHVVQVERIRRAFMRWMREVLDGVDMLVVPPYAGGMLVVTNATGHPSLCLRAGFDAPNAPRSITLIGRPFEEQRLIEVGAALERRLDVAGKRPEMQWMQGA